MASQIPCNHFLLVCICSRQNSEGADYVTFTILHRTPSTIQCLVHRRLSKHHHRRGMYCIVIRHWDMLNIYRAHLFNLYHNLKRWGPTILTDEESKERQSIMPEMTTAGEWSSRELEGHLFKFFKSATPIPDTVPSAPPARRK